MRAVRIGGVVAAVDCRVRRLLPIVEAMLALYPPSRARAQLCFSLTEHAGSVRLACNGELLWQGEPFETAAALEVHWYLRVLACLRRRFVSLHGGWAVVGGRAIAVAGVSGAGKSSLVTAAVLAGAPYGSDEFVLVDRHGDVHPFARPLQWGCVRHPAFSHAEMRAAGACKFRFCFRDHEGRRRLNLWWLPRRVRRRKAPLALLALVRFAPERGVHIAPLARSLALAALVSEMHTRTGNQGEDLQRLHRWLPKDLPIVQLQFDDARAAWQALLAYARRISATTGR